MARLTALLDANVLYPAIVRDILISLASNGFFHARWTEKIHEEWINAALKNNAHLKKENLLRTKSLMNTAIRDSLVTGYESLTNSIELPDPDDRHVLAAAIIGCADLIVTANLKDFPEEILAPYEIQAMHPDDFLNNQRNICEAQFLGCIKDIRKRLKNPPVSAEEYLEKLQNNNLPITSAELAKVKGLL